MKIIPEPGQDKYRYGQGTVYIIRQDPKELVMQPGQDASFIKLVKDAYRTAVSGKSVELKNNFYVQRGPYHIIAVVDESVDSTPIRVQGPFIDLFDPGLPVLSEKVVHPGEQAYLFDLKKISNKQNPRVLAAASRIYEESIGKNSYSFISKSPADTWNMMRICLPSKPQTLRITDHQGKDVTQMQMSWHEQTNTCLLQFENFSEGRRVEIYW
jgi:hypothetical protein